MTRDKAAKVAQITGITGQDGVCMAEFLLQKGCVVRGIKRRLSLFNANRVERLHRDPRETDNRFILHYGDLTDSANRIYLIQSVQPDEIYNLGAQSRDALHLG